MALVVNDRVKETTAVVGTGIATLLGAALGFQSFAVIGNGNTTYYCISDQGGANWEVGIGTYLSSGNTLARTTVLASSNAGALVAFTTGVKDIFVTYPAEKSVYLDASGNAIGLGTPASGTLTNCTFPQLSDSTGSVLIGTTNGVTGSVTRTVASKLNETVSVKDFGAVGDGVTDDTAALNAASAACAISGQKLFVPNGIYKITSTWFINQVSVKFDNAGITKLQCIGSFTAVRIISTRCRFDNFNIWFSTSPAVSSLAIGIQFGNGASQFNRNVVTNCYVRYAYTSYYSSSDMWGNVFTQINSDFSLYGYNFTANPSGTTNSFRNIYATGLATTGSISAGSAVLTVAAGTNFANAYGIVIIGAGSGGKLQTTIASVIGNTITLNANASTTVVDAQVYILGTAWSSVGFSDLHLYNAYFDGFCAFSSGSGAIVYFADSVVTADAIRFEGCAVVANNVGMIDDRSNNSNITNIVSFAHWVDVGSGNVGYVYRCGTNANTSHQLGDIALAYFKYNSGTLKKAFLASNDSLVATGSTITASDSYDNGFEGCLFLAGFAGRAVTATPATGSWDSGSTYVLRSTTAGGMSGGVCTAAGTFGTLNSGATTATTTSGRSMIIVNSLTGLTRGAFIKITGVSGIFKVMDIDVTLGNYVLLSGECGASVAGAAVSFAVPTFVRSGTLELVGSATYNPPSIAIAASDVSTITVTGAALGDYCTASFSNSLQGMSIAAYVSAVNTVSVVLTNNRSAAIDLTSGTMRVRVFKQ